MFWNEIYIIQLYMRMYGEVCNIWEEIYGDFCAFIATTQLTFFRNHERKFYILDCVKALELKDEMQLKIFSISFASRWLHIMYLPNFCHCFSCTYLNSRFVFTFNLVEKRANLKRVRYYFFLCDEKFMLCGKKLAVKNSIEGFSSRKTRVLINVHKQWK